MTALGEATRQYQAALEHDRRARTELDGVVSAADEMTASTSDVDDAWLHMGRLWNDHTKGSR